MKILAIETSCDETAAAVIDVNRSLKTVHRKKQTVNCEPLTVNILSNIVSSQIAIHRKFGGIFPEYASRAHTERIIPVVEEALLLNEPCALQSKSRNPSARLKRGRALRPDFLAGQIEAGTLRALASDIDFIAVTAGPGLIGSLLVGVNFAKTLACVTNKPIIGINHWLGHIYSNFVQVNSNLKTLRRLGRSPTPKVVGQSSKLPNFPALILIASGGHTGLVLMKSHADIKPLGETLDDAAGEAFDKVAKLLELPYPGGPSIAASAASLSSLINPYSPLSSFHFPRSMLDRKDYNFSFSGLKTAVLYKVKELESQGITINHYQSLIAASFQQTVIDILIGKTIQAAYEFFPKSICLCGGVAANKELREQMVEAVDQLPYNPSFHIPSIQMSTDNAAMIGIAAAYQTAYGKPTTDYRYIKANANLRL